MKDEILRLLRMVKRDGMDNLIKFLLESDFFDAPASTKFHGNFEGGNAIHGLKTYEALYHLDAWLKTKLPLDTMIICGLLHDACKIGIYRKEKIKDPLPEGISENPWVREDPFPLGHSEKSISILQDYIKLTELEKILIRWHMGAYDPSLRMNSKALEKTFPKYKLLYLADEISSGFMEETR